MWQLIYGNGIAERGGIKIVAIDLWQCCCRNGRKKKVAIDLWILILDSYSKKYSYSYSFRVSVVFLTEAVWFVCM